MAYGEPELPVYRGPRTMESGRRLSFVRCAKSGRAACEIVQAPTTDVRVLHLTSRRHGVLCHMLRAALYESMSRDRRLCERACVSVCGVA